jgi:hypothetical protein
MMEFLNRVEQTGSAQLSVIKSKRLWNHWFPMVSDRSLTVS